MDVRTALRQGTEILHQAGVPFPRLTAEVLLCHALQRDRTYLYTHPEDELSEIGWIHYGRYLHQRTEGKPTQYITKTQEFFGRPFLVTPDVLIPRPETEHVVSAALERLSSEHATVIDIGCGSGAIAITLSLEARTSVLAADISLPALRVAATNAERLQADVSFSCCDLTTALADLSADMIVSNPPYVGLNEADGLQREVRQYEPHVALFAGERGTDLYGRLIADAHRVLRPGGWLIMELGWRSFDPVRAMMDERWVEVDAVSDLSGIPRVLCARLT